MQVAALAASCICLESGFQMLHNVAQVSTSLIQLSDQSKALDDFVDRASGLLTGQRQLGEPPWKTVPIM